MLLIACHHGQHDNRIHRMKKQRTLRMYSWALIVSGLLNAFVISSAFVTPSNVVAALYLRIANWVAAPSGYFADKMFVPRQHTAIALITSGLESTCLSFLLYAAVTWSVLRVILLLQSARPMSR
jgi:hypothetical protein